MLVKNLMSTDVISVKDNIMLTDVVNIMGRNNVNYIPVLNSDNKVSGFISAADIIKNLTAKDGQIKDFKVSDIMTHQNITLDSEMDIHKACEIMAQNKLTTVPVENIKGICGILSIKDLSQKRVFLAEISEIISAKYRNSDSV